MRSRESCFFVGKVGKVRLGLGMSGLALGISRLLP
jgi:hypothetical protein